MDKNLHEIGFIGTGNMGKSLIKGVLKSGLYKQDDIIATDKQNNILEYLSREFGISTTNSNIELAKKTKVLILCVKPQNMKEVLIDIRDVLTDSHLIISIAAGISIRAITKTIMKDLAVIRVMPNTPALVQKGMSGIAYGKYVKEEHKRIVLDIFNSIGKTIVVKEDMIDLITAISGSGPGYIFRIMECMVCSAKKMGLDEKSAKKLVIQTFIGSSYLANESKESLSTLRKMVTSPKGTTEAGLSVFEKANIMNIIHNAIKAAYEKSIEIKKEWEKEA